jgi:hypothetical protein
MRVLHSATLCYVSLINFTGFVRENIRVSLLRVTCLYVSTFRFVFVLHDLFTSATRRSSLEHRLHDIGQLS